MSIEVITPNWPMPPNVRAGSTTRTGGVSTGAYESLNLGSRCDDDPDAVAKNRALLSEHLQLPATPLWLQQEHGTTAVAAHSVAMNVAADASWTHQAGVVCVAQSADCLPVLFCDRAGTIVGAAHAGWRGLLDGVLESTIVAMTDAASIPAINLMAWLGPAIGPERFEVGADVRDAFVEAQGDAAEWAFSYDEAASKAAGADRWMGDFYRLARQRLVRAGILQVFGGDYCTHSDADKFFSYRRDGVTGRMASLIWLAE